MIAEEFDCDIYEDGWNDDFNALEMCCACGGGTTGGSDQGGNEEGGNDDGGDQEPTG